MRYWRGSVFAVAALGVLPLTAQPPAASTTSATLSKYCATCHNAKIKTAGFVIKPAEAANPSLNTAAWEKVIRKLRTGEMPPAGAPRPDAATYELMASF